MRGEGQCDDWLAGLGNARRSSACCKALLKLSMFLIAASRATGYGIGTDDRVWICQIRALSRSMSMLAPGRAGVRAVACDSSRKLCWALACKDGGGEPGHEPSDGVSRSVAWTESEGAWVHLLLTRATVVWLLCYQETLERGRKEHPSGQPNCLLQMWDGRNLKALWAQFLKTRATVVRLVCYQETLGCWT